MFAAPYNARKSLAQKCLITTLIRLKYLNFRAKDTQNWICKTCYPSKKIQGFSILIFSAKIQIFRLFYLLEVQIFSVKISNIWVGKLLTKTNFGNFERWCSSIIFLGEMLEKVNQQILKVGQSSTHTCRQMLENQIKSGDNVISLVLSSKG